jgi:hypothetical protein
MTEPTTTTTTPTTSAPPAPSPSSTATTTTSSASSSSPITGLQLAIAVLVLGSSAGLTLYTRKTGSMLRTMETIKANQMKNRPPIYGPPSKAEWEKLKPRFDKDEFI